MFSKILVPIDLQSPKSTFSNLGFAMKVAGQESRITAINVIHELPQYVIAQLPQDVIDNQETNARRELDRCLSDYDVEIEGKIIRGHVANSITEYAKKTGSDLIVVGSHDKDAIDHLIGSTAERVVRNAECSVLVIRS